MPTFCRISLLLFPTLLAGPGFAQGTAPSTNWTVHDIYYLPAAAASPAETEWSPDGARLSYRSPDGTFGAIDARTGQRTVLTPASKLAGIAARTVNEKDKDHRTRYQQKGYFWSPNGSEVLFDEDGTLWLDSLKSGGVRQIGDTGQGSGDDAKFSPDGQTISYLHNHNLYALRLGSGGGAPVPLTATADPNLLNGEVDWVYLEELKVRTNYSWSPDSAHIAYVQMDETKVPTYPLTDWIPTHATVDEQKYPQAGDPNPAVRVGIVAATGGATRWVSLPEVRANQDYIPRSGWLDAHTVWIETLRRDHKHLDIWFANAETGVATRALALTDPKFFDENYDVNFFRPGDMLLRSWRSEHTHIDHYTYSASAPAKSGLKLARQLEDGPYEVADILSVVPSREGGTVYYMSNEGDPLQAQVWAVGLDGSGKQQVTQAEGVHKVAFADGHGSYTDTHSDLRTPPVLDICSIGSSGENSSGNACTNIWKGSVPAGHAVHTPEILKLKAADGRTTIYASLLLPEGQTAAASVPLITNPYGGPGTATVTDTWGAQSFYFDQLLSEHGFAVLHVDNRGMANRGREFEQAAYHDFGKVQLADQLAAIDQVLAKYPQLDSKRLGWWGWSWGGTFTLNALTHSDRFRAGVSVAPVTDFRNYDSIYTERYLGLPVAEAGEPAETAIYNAAAVQPTAAHLHGRLLLVHGTGDDNVHIENTVQFVQKLIDNDLPYDLQIYPRKTHSITGKEARTQLFERILAHWEHYLKPTADVAGKP